MFGISPATKLLPKGTIFTGMKLNADPESETARAVTDNRSPYLDDDGTLHEIRSVEIDLRPVNITGDVIAPSDEVSKTVIYNWKTDNRLHPTHHPRRLRLLHHSYDSTTPTLPHTPSGANTMPISILIRSQSDSLGVGA
ncbi:hypothetical protein EDD85DRAFT_953376 [Armillaria nabsnona]|nr:hypothetical protein EDD85DRAFT_953376 [Armillaria nabsnona]